MSSSSRSAHEPQQLARTLMSWVNARTWDESQRIVEQHPELLGEKAEELLEQIESAQPDAEAVRVLQEHRELLARCRDVGSARAFAEKQLPAEALVEAQRRSLTPEEFLAQLRAAHQMPPQLGEVLAELAAGGVEIRTAEELEHALVTRSDLRARLEQAVQAASDGPVVPPEFTDDLGAAQEAEQHHLRSGDRAALDRAAAAWTRILQHSAFSASPQLFRLAVLNGAGGVFLRRYWASGAVDDLDRVLDLLEKAVGATLPDSPDLPMYLNNLGNGLRERSRRTGREADLEEAIRVYQKSVEATPLGSPNLPGYLNNLGNGLRDRSRRTGREADLEEAIRVYRQAVEATPPNSPDLPMFLNNLGTGLSDRHGRTRREADLEEAIRVYRQAVEATPPDSPDLPMYLNNLGTSLSDRFGRTGREADLEESIRVSQQAVEATPSNSPDLPRYLDNLGTGLRARFGRFGREADLEEAIRVHRLAVGGTPPDSPDLPMYLNNLGTGLSDRHGRTGREADLEEAIRVYRQAVEATPPDSPDLPMYLNNLGTGLSDRHGRTGREEDMGEAIRVYRRSVEATPPNSPDLPMFLNNLGTGLSQRHGRMGREADMEEAIRVYRQAVEATPPDSPDLPMFLKNLGSGLHARSGRTGREADLEEAIRVHRQAVEATPPDSPDLPGYLNNLGTALSDRFGRTGRAADLEESIRVLQQAAEATPLHSPDLPGYLNNLGKGFSIRFGRTGREADLEAAIRVYRQAVEATQRDSPELPVYLTNLGAGLSIRFGRAGREADLEEAIRVYQQAVEATPLDSPHLPGYLSNLGTGLSGRFRRTGREADLEESIRVSQQAVEATPSDSPDLPRYLDNLGTGLRARFGRVGREADLEEAIRVHRLAVGGTPPNSPDLPKYVNNLGNSLSNRCGRTGRVADLDEAIRLYRQAVEATPPESPNLTACLNNLGNGLCDRFARTGWVADLNEAIRVYQQVLEVTPPDSPDLPMYLNNLGNGLCDRFARTGWETDQAEAIRVFRRACELGTLSGPQIVLGAARNWGRWAFQRKQWAETAEAYGYGLTTGHQLLVRQLRREDKESWLRDLQEMSGTTAYALAKLNRFEEAATTMERGRARLLAEALQRRRRDLDQLPARGHTDLHQRYREIVERQEQLTRPETRQADQAGSLSGQARLDAIIAANTAFNQVVADIQKIPGYADFLAEPTFSQIQAATSETPLAYLLATSAGGLALIVYNDEVQPVWLDTLTDGLVRELLTGPANITKMGGWLGAYQNWLREHSPQTQRAWFEAIDHVTHRLWTHVMEPLAEALQRLKPSVDSFIVPSVTLIPAGLLALLPLHAAWAEDTLAPTGRRYFLDEFTVNYAPSALALGHAQEQAEHAAQRLLAVEEPLAAGASKLPNVRREVAAIAGLFDNPVVLVGKKATREAVLAALPEADVVHFSCHGSNDWQSPLDSGLLMADDETGWNVKLTVRDLLESDQRGGRLVTLSACETGIVGTKLPDEVVALPSASLQAGYGGVAASLWSVADISTAMLMEYFYAGWRSEEGNKLSPAEALRIAQRWLRDTTNREKAEYFERVSSQFSGTRISEGVAIKRYNELTRHLDSRDYAHPFWWAAFYLTGG